MTKISEIKTGSWQSEPDKNRFLDWVGKYINSLTNRKFYGSLTLSFESGKVTTCKLEETIKPNL